MTDEQRSARALIKMKLAIGDNIGPIGCLSLPNAT